MTTEQTPVASGYRLIIPRVPPSLNRNKHWAAKHREMKTWMLEIKAAGGKQQAKGKMRVTITLHNARQYDSDNAWGACKPILDAMKAWGLIIDDRASCCDLTVLQEKSTRKDRHTVIEVEPCA